MARLTPAHFVTTLTAILTALVIHVSSSPHRVRLGWCYRYKSVRSLFARALRLS